MNSKIKITVVVANPPTQDQAAAMIEEINKKLKILYK